MNMKRLRFFGDAFCLPHCEIHIHDPNTSTLSFYSHAIIKVERAPVWNFRLPQLGGTFLAIYHY